MGKGIVIIIDLVEMFYINVDKVGVEDFLSLLNFRVYILCYGDGYNFYFYVMKLGFFEIIMFLDWFIEFLIIY